MRNNWILLPIISIFIVAAFLYKAQVFLCQNFLLLILIQVDNTKKEVSQVKNLSSNPQSTLDCLTWTNINYSTVEHDDEELVVEDDAYNNRKEKFNVHILKSRLK